MKIYGVFDPNRGHEELTTLLETMKTQLNPEQYWKSSNFITENIGIGHVYSEVINQDRQPIWNESNTKFIVMAGKIFDYETRKKELIEKGHVFTYANSDAEFILHSLDEWGEQSIRDLNGFFAFALYDIAEKSLVIVNDRGGMKPFYYYSGNAMFVFASEVKAIIKDNKVTKKINWEGWRDIFSYGHLLGTKTLFEDIHALPPATILTVKNACDISFKQYWTYSEIKVDHNRPEQYFVDKGIFLLRQAIERQTRHLKKCIVLLSGGYDSRFIASAIRYYTNVSFETFTATSSPMATSFERRIPLILDGILAPEIAKSLKVRNTYVPELRDLYRKYLVDKVFLLDGMSLEHLWILPLVDSLGGQINFDGLAGDFQLKGKTAWWAAHALQRGSFPDEFNLASTDDFRKLALLLDQRMRGFLSIPTEIIIEFFDSLTKEKLKPRIEPLLKEIKAIGNHENIVTIFFLVNRTKNATALSPNNLISKKACCFFPFLDKDVVEFSLTIPPTMKHPKRIYLRMLAKMFPRIMQIPSTNYIISRASIEQWGKKFFRLLPSLLEHFLASARTDTPSFRKETPQLLDLLESLRIPPFVDVNKIKNRTQEHLDTGRNPIPFLVPILEFCIWYNIFFCND